MGYQDSGKSRPIRDGADPFSYPVEVGSAPTAVLTVWGSTSLLMRDHFELNFQLAHLSGERSGSKSCFILSIQV